MPGATPALLFYDDGCGPCTVFARASRGLARRRVEIRPLADPGSDRYLGSLSTEQRFGSFHLSSRGRLESGTAALPEWVGLFAGACGERAVRGVPPIRSGVERVYRLLWNHRRTHGCAAPA